MNSFLTRAWLEITTPRVRDDRGDVPGWVLITVMTAGVVTALAAVAKVALPDALSNAINSVKP